MNVFLLNYEWNDGYDSSGIDPIGVYSSMEKAEEIREIVTKGLFAQRAVINAKYCRHCNVHINFHDHQDAPIRNLLLHKCEGFEPKPGPTKLDSDEELVIVELELDKTSRDGLPGNLRDTLPEGAL